MTAKLWSKRLLLGSILGLLGLFHILFPFQIGVVQGASMEPSFRSGQVILIDRRYYRNHPLRRGDVIVFRQEDGVLIKRVFGLAGDSFWTLMSADDGELYRDIIQPEMLPKMRRLMNLLHSYRITRITVPPKTVYVVGDHTSASVDSRQFGPVPIGTIMGRVTNAPPLPDSNDSTPPAHGTMAAARPSINY
jgi:signal peptidase I